MTRRSARSGYGPDDDIAGLGGRTARYRAAGPYGPGRPGGGRGPRRGAGRDPRALVGRDGTPLSPGQKILRGLWYGRWWRQWSFKKVGLLFGALAATMALVLVATFFVVLSVTKVPIVALSRPLTQSSIVYFSNGKEVGCFCTADRTVLTEDQIKQSKYLWEAVLAAEDRAFFTEGGISLTGLARAIKNDLSGGSIQGGSTITEQFVKTYYSTSGGNLNIRTKIKEIFVAIKLSKMESKWWILTHYLNAIPLGSGANGVQAAAQTYFNRKAWQLTLAQAAMIAAMIQAPYGYDPANPTAIPSGLPNSLLDRWVYVLTNMVRDGAITQQQMNALVPDPSNPRSALKNFPKIKPSSPQSNWPGYRGYIMNLVANELAAYYHMNYSTTELGNLGLQIHTTLNERLMNALYGTIAAEKQRMASMGVPLPSYVHISAVLEKPGTGKILAFYGGPGFGVQHCSWYHCNVDTILTAEPVGSSFKPYVLATAVAQGMNVRTSVMNSHSPLCIPPDWTPQLQLQLSKQTLNCPTSNGYWLFNEGGENFAQNLTVPQATAVSNDPTFEDLIHRTTVQKVINMAATLGVSPYDVAGLNALFGDGCLKKYPNCHPGAQAAALGEGSLNAVDQANTFSVLVSGGKLVTPHVISYITQNGVRLTPGNGFIRDRALQPAVAADTDYALSFDTSCLPGAGCGTGVPNAVWPGRPMIAKTGTLGTGASASQAWFVGAIPQYSMAVGMFTDKPNTNPPQILDALPTLGPWSGGYGGAWPATIWHAFMTGQFSNLPVRQLPTPSYAGTDPLFTKWIMALPPKKKQKRCQQGQGPGPGNGQGHHHHWWWYLGQGNGQCQKGGPPTGSPTPNPSPSPNPSGSPSPHPTVTPTSPNPSGSPSSTGPPGPAPSLGPLSVKAANKKPVPHPAVALTSLATLGTLPTAPWRRPASIVTTGLT